LSIPASTLSPALTVRGTLSPVNTDVSNDDFSLKRVINRPKRGLGKVSLAKIEKIAFEHKLSLFEAISSLDENDKDLSKKIVSSLGEFAANLRELKECDSPYELVDKLEAKFGVFARGKF